MFHKCTLNKTKPWDRLKTMQNLNDKLEFIEPSEIPTEHSTCLDE